MLSVIIPTYNDDDLNVVHVRECMEGTVVPDEIIVVNDGGDPGLKEKLKVIPNKCKIIYADILPPKIPWNYTGARNLGFWLSRGDFISLEDNDHIPSKTFYSEALEALATNPKLGVARTQGRVVISREDILTKPVEEWQRVGTRTSHKDCGVYHRETYLKLKGYDERFAGEYGWSATFWQRRMDKIGIEIGNVGFQYVVDSPKTTGLSYRNWRLARRKDNTHQHPKGIINFEYSFETW